MKMKERKGKKYITTRKRISKQIDYILHIIYENEEKKKRNIGRKENESAKTLTSLYIIYENEEQEKEIAE